MGTANTNTKASRASFLFGYQHTPWGRNTFLLDRVSVRYLILQNKTENLSETEISDLLEYINSLESLREQSYKPNLFDDEIVSLLSDSVENRRARVVVEWDKIRRRADYRAANFAAARK